MPKRSAVVQRPPEEPARDCRQCGNELLRLSPDKPPGFDVVWGAAATGYFYCQKCDVQHTFPLERGEARDLELAPRAQA